MTNKTGKRTGSEMYWLCREQLRDFNVLTRPVELTNAARVSHQRLSFDSTWPNLQPATYIPIGRVLGELK